MFATVDTKPGLLGAQIARCLDKNHGLKPLVFATGPSVKFWTEAGIRVQPQNPLTSVGFGVAFHTQSPPKAVVVGLSSPRGGEYTVEKNLLGASFSLGIPTVFLDDDWGCFHRVPQTPDLYLTIDRLSERLLKETHPGVPTALMGDDAAGVVPSEGAVRAVEELRSNKGIVVQLYGDKDPRAFTALEFTLRCLEQSEYLSERSVVVTTFHPGSTPEYQKRCERLVADFSRAYPGTIEELKGVRGDELAALADITVGVRGTGIRVASHHGKTPILPYSPDIEQMMLEESGAGRHPLAAAGAGLELAVPASFAALLKRDEPLKKKRQEFLDPPIPFSPEKAAAAIAKLVK